jgi:ribosomal protein S18 acetylase RimI-like enzyme
MTNSIEHLDPATIALTLDANKIAYGAYLSTYPGAVFHDDPGITWFETGVALDMFNGVLQIQQDAATLPSAIDRVLAHFQRRRLPFQWHLGPSSRPADAGALLRARGIAHVEAEPGMAVELSALNEQVSLVPHLTIQPVTTPDELHRWAEVWGCGAPPEVTRQWTTFYSQLRFGPQEQFRYYLGLVDGEPVATSALFLGAGVASVEHVVTLPQARRQGIGAAMTLHAARDARGSGYRVGMLFASPMGITIYRRLGFREYGLFSTFEWQPANSQDEQPRQQ